jgi:hypothetical protein
MALARYVFLLDPLYSALLASLYIYLLDVIHLAVYKVATGSKVVDTLVVGTYVYSYYFDSLITFGNVC